MYENLYRGKRKDGEWVNGFGIGFYHIGTPEEKAYIVAGDDGVVTRVIPKTVGQCTGIPDKNAKLMFHGDIVKYHNYLFVVQYGRCGGVVNGDNHGYIGFYLEGYDRYTKQCIANGLRDDIYYFADHVEVIGNIHDNPDLLEGFENDKEGDNNTEFIRNHRKFHKSK